MSVCVITVSTKILINATFCFQVFNTDDKNVSRAPNQRFRIISEEGFLTAEISALSPKGQM